MKLELGLRLIHDLELGDRAGGLFRGALSNALRYGACPGEGRRDRCGLGRECSFHYLFDTRPSKGSPFLSGVSTAPRPLLLEPPAKGRYTAGSRAALGIVLIGLALEHWVAVIQAVERVGASGLGRSGCQFDLESVYCEAGPSPRLLWHRDVHDRAAAPEPLVFDFRDARKGPEEATLAFESPTVLKHRGREVPPEDFAVFFVSLMRRIALLSEAHCGGRVLEDPSVLLDPASTVETVRTELDERRWYRYSTRQRRKVPMGGWTGTVEFQGPLDRLWPWIVAGQHVHVGSGATFGNGRYRIASHPASTGAEGAT